MPKNPDKVAGNKGPCFKCGKEIICGTVEFKGEAKLQWQNADGKAHYTKDGNCKDTEQSVSNAVETIKSEPVKLADVKLSQEILPRILKVAGEATQILKAIEYAVDEDQPGS